MKDEKSAMGREGRRSKYLERLAGQVMRVQGGKEVDIFKSSKGCHCDWNTEDRGERRGRNSGPKRSAGAIPHWAL